MWKLFALAWIVLPLAALRAETYGGIDVGSRAVRARLFVFQGNGEGRNAKELFSRTMPVALATGMADGKFSPASIAETSKNVSALLGQMMELARTSKLGEVQYFILGSSGLSGAANRDQLKDAIAQQTGGFGIQFIDAKTEGFHGLRSAVPEPRRGEAVMVETGSTNTTIGCVVTDGGFQSADVPYGTVSLRNSVLNATSNGSPSYDAAVKSMVDGTVKPAMRREVLNNPCFANRPRIYWTGAAAWAAATYTHPERALNAYVALTRADIDQMLEKLKGGNWQSMPRLVLPNDLERQRTAIAEQAERDWKSVQDSFVREDLVSSLSLFRALLDFANPSAKVVFARGGNYLYGYALEHYVESKALAVKAQK